MEKKIIALAAALCVAASSVLGGGSVFAVSDDAGAVNEDARLQKTGKLMMEYVETDFGDADVLEAPSVPEKMYSSEKKSRKYSHDWDVYSSNYAYNSLSQSEMAFWDVLDEMCLEYLTGVNVNATAQVVGSQTYYRMDVLSSQVLTFDQMCRVYDLFLFENPQYYFLSYTSTLTNEEAGYLAPVVYDAFARGADRQVATGEFADGIEAILSEVDASASEYDKAKALTEILCHKVTYLDGDYNEEEYFTQSAYSAIVKNDSVCAGYSQAFTLLANALGVDAMTVTSILHQWNKVRIDDSWYVLDVTWCDDDLHYLTSADNTYDYFLRSDERRGGRL